MGFHQTCKYWHNWDFRRKRGRESLHKEIAKNFPNRERDSDIQVEEANKSPYHINAKRTFPGRIIMKFLKVKDKEKLKSIQVRGKIITYRGSPL